MGLEDMGVMREGNNGWLSNFIVWVIKKIKLLREGGKRMDEKIMGEVRGIIGK